MSDVIIKLKAGNSDIEISIKEARELYDLLHVMFDAAPVVPQPIWYNPIQPYQPNYPYYRPDITCNTMAQ